MFLKCPRVTPLQISLAGPAASGKRCEKEANEEHRILSDFKNTRCGGFKANRFFVWPCSLLFHLSNIDAYHTLEQPKAQALGLLVPLRPGLPVPSTRFLSGVWLHVPHAELRLSSAFENPETIEH